MEGIRDGKRKGGRENSFVSSYMPPFHPAGGQLQGYHGGKFGPVLHARAPYW